MEGRLRSSKTNEFEIGDAFEKVIKGLRHEISTVIGKIERNKELTLEAMKGLLKGSLEAMVGSVECMINGISDEMLQERKRRDGEDKRREVLLMQGVEECGVRERKKREVEEKRREVRIKRVEDKDKERSEELNAMAEKVEEERVETFKVIKGMEDRLEKVEEKLEHERKERERIEETLLELERNETAYRDKEAERTMNRQKVVRAKASEKIMEEKVCAAMEEMKILDLDFGRVIEKKEEIVKEALEIIRENVKLKDRKEWEWSVRRSRIMVLGQQTKEKDFKGKKIHTVPLLFRCISIGEKERLERLVRNSGIRVSIHWPKEMLDFVKGVRKRMEEMGHGGREEFVRVRPVKQEGSLFIRADVRRREGGKFTLVADWRCPAVNKEFWALADDIMLPCWTATDVGNRN